MSSNECQTGSLGQQFAIFLNPIRDLSQNWEIDISKLLEEYLEKIDGIEKNLQNRCSTNFTEAAFVIQGSVNIYCKKVDYLEKVILEFLSDSGRNKGNNCNIETDSKNKGRVKKMNSSSNELAFENLDDIPINKHIDMVNDDDDHFKSKIKFLQKVPILLEKGENNDSQNIELLEKCEFISAKADFYLNRCYQRPDGSLSITPLTNSFQNKSKTNGSVMVYEPTLVFQDCNKSFNDPVTEPNDLEICNEEKQPDVNEQNTEVPIAQNSNGNIDEFQRIDECEVQPETSKDLNNNISEEKYVTTSIKLPNGKRSSLHKRTSVCPKQQPQPWIESDPHTCSLPNRAVTCGKIRRLIRCTCHTPMQRKSYNPNIYIRDKVLRESGLDPVDVYISKSFHKFLNKNYLKVLPEIIEAANNERLKRQNILKTRQAGEIEDQNISEELREIRQGLNEVIKENIEDDYNQLLLDDDLIPAPTDTSFDVENIVLEPAVPPDPIQIQINEENLAFEPITQEEWNKISDHLYEPCTMIEAALQRTMAHHMLRAQESNEIFQCVNRWKSNIVPKLNIEEKRKIFDIHAYGHEIINKFAEIGETLSFDDVTKEFPQKDIPRVFLSCLMLGNSYNVNLHRGEILSMDDLKLTLLSQVQQHQHMDDYAAPSQKQISPKRKRSESMVTHHRGKKTVSFADSGICTKMEDYAAPSQKQISPKRKRSESMVTHDREKNKKTVSFADSGICTSILSGTSFNSTNN